jgi:hypothetical protein
MRTTMAALILLLAPAPAPAHRLDEYLQATMISIGTDRLEAEITLTPGVAVFPMLIADIDRDADGVVSEAEQRAYGRKVLRDLLFTIDGRRLRPQLRSMQFPSLDEMREGRGGIRIELTADLPRGGAGRKLVFENHHRSGIGAYLVNCLVPRDPDIRIVAQNRNYSQSVYQLDYVQTAAAVWWSGEKGGLGALALLLLVRFALLWQRRDARAPFGVRRSHAAG